MDKRFHESGITRFVEPGETISGFVFTHLSPGTKSFNADLFGLESGQNFAFFVKDPGFVPDHAEVDFQGLYANDEIRDLSTEEFRSTLVDLATNTTDANGQANGLPVNAMIVGKGLDVFGRPQDMAFQKARDNIHERNHLRLWMAPVTFEGKPVWMGQISRDIGVRFTKKTITTHKIDPDTDETREFLLENLAYSQALEKFAYVEGAIPAPIDNPRGNFTGDPYFTDGYRLVLWVTVNPVDINDIEYVYWSHPREL